MMEILLWIFGGGVGGAALAFLLKRMGGEWRWRGLMIALVAMTAIYVVLGVQYGDMRAVALEALSGGALVALAVIFWKRRALVLPGLILMHGAMDAAHLQSSSPIVADWYGWACLGFDGVLGLAAILFFSSGESGDE